MRQVTEAEAKQIGLSQAVVAESSLDRLALGHVLRTEGVTVLEDGENEDVLLDRPSGDWVVYFQGCYHEDGSFNVTLRPAHAVDFAASEELFINPGLRNASAWVVHVNGFKVVAKWEVSTARPC